MPRRDSQKNGPCSLCGRKSGEPLCDLAGEDRSIFREVRTEAEYPAGHVIFHQGQPPLAVYCLSAGGVKIYKTAASGGQIIIRVLGPGELLGYRPVLGNEPYAATAEAVTATTACVIARESFLAGLSRSPTLCMRLLEKMARELRISEDQLLNLASEPVRKRLARLLVLMLQAAGTPLQENMLVPTTCRRAEMAQMIGTTPETLSRTLRLLASQRLIRSTRTEIRVLDPNGLAEAAALDRAVDENSDLT